MGYLHDHTQNQVTNRLWNLSVYLLKDCLKSVLFQLTITIEDDYAEEDGKLLNISFEGFEMATLARQEFIKKTGRK